MGPAVSPEIVGRYAVYGALAAGGMATVHLGRLVGPVGFSRTVAVKRLRADFIADPEFVSMFADEARLAGRIRHPNVVAVIDVVSTDKELLLIMEYVEGETLARLMQIASESGNPIPPAIGAAIVRDALVGLHAAHETKDEKGNALGIIHRDISPQNVIVGVDGVARVLDFGIAKAFGRSQVTRDGNIKGKLAYMAPEQLEGKVSRSTDTFAVSIVLWEVLTGERLFRGDTDAETVMKVLAAPIPKPSEVRPSLGTSYDDLVLKGLSREPTAGFETARDMATALAKAVDLPDGAQIGEWVASIARDRLRERERIVAEVESGTAFPRITREGSLAPPNSSGETRLNHETRVAAAPRARRLVWPIVVGSLVLVAGAGFALSRRAARVDKPPVVAVTASQDPAALLERGPTPPIPTPAPAESMMTDRAAAPSASASAPPSASASARPPARPPRAPAAGGTTKPSASPRIPDHL